jgi:hypothetical protein
MRLGRAGLAAWLPKSGFTRTKTAVFAPTPRAKVSTAMIVNDGLLVSIRNPY